MKNTEFLWNKAMSGDFDFANTGCACNTWPPRPPEDHVQLGLTKCLGFLQVRIPRVEQSDIPFVLELTNLDETKDLPKSLDRGKESR